LDSAGEREKDNGGGSGVKEGEREKGFSSAL